jgi:arabinogalactan oligomer / maltooligosaccharide transport system substrate-binding protein
MRKQLRFASIVAGMAIIAAACSSGGATSAPSAASAAPGSQAPASAPAGGELAYKGEITFWNTMRDFEAKEVQKLIDTWTAKHAGITVKMDLVPFDGADKKYETAANASNAPDIFRSDVGWVSGFADAGYLADLSSVVSDSSDFLDAPLGSVRYQGKLYGVPSVTDALGLQCNKKLLADAGLTEAPKTWDELVEKGKTVTDISAKKYGFYMRGDSYWAQPFIWGWGGTLFTADDQGKVTAIGVNGPEAVSGWTYLKDKILGTVAPKTWDFKTDYDNMNAGFKAGTTMCVLQGPWQVADIQTGDAFKADPTNLVIAPVPDGAPGKTGSPVGGHDFVVFVDAMSNPDKAAAVVDLLNAIDGTDAQVSLAKSLGLLPTRKSAYDNADVKADPLISAWGQVLAKATNRAGVPGAQNIYKPFSDHFQAFIGGSETAQQALDAIANAWKTDVFKSRYTGS